MKRISYTTTMALLLACAVLTTPVFAMQSQQLSLDQQLVSDIGLSPAAEVVTRPNGNLQSAPTFGEIAMVPVNLISRGLGALTQSALCAGGVKTVVKHDQPVSAFEAAAFNRINQTEEKLRQFAASAQEKGIDLDSPKLSEEELRYLAELAKRSGIKLEVGQQSFAIQGIGTTLASRQLDRRCPTVRAYDAAVEQRYANEKVYLKDLLQKIAEKDPKRLKLYVKENYELLKALDLNDKSSEGDKAQAFVARGLGVLPGTHAVVKCGYQYSLRPVLGGVLDRVGLGCSGTKYDLTTDSSFVKTGGKFPVILNQGGTEACVAHAFSSAIDFARRAQGLPNQTPARSFIWSWTRQIGSSSHAFDGGPHKYLGNWGCSMNIAGDLVSNQGAPSEESDYGCKWYSDMKAHADADNTMTRYDSSALSATAHGETDVAGALSFIHQSDTNTLLANVNAIKCAISGGYPVLIGIDVRRSSYYNDDVATSGHFVMPFSRTDMVDGVTFNNSIDYDHPVGGDDKNPIYGAGDFSVGGHAILLVGYDDDNQRFKFMNSWGTWWGDNGYGTLPYNYVCGTTGSYKAPAGLLTGHTTDTNGHNVDYAPFKSAPYAGYFGQIKSCTK